MKILIVIFEINNLGGIINNTEDLIAGFMEIGHEVDLVQLVWKHKVSGKRTRTPEAYADGILYKVSQLHGWLWPDGKRIPYKGHDNIQRWREYASKYDLIFWQIPVPTMAKGNRGNCDWPHLYEIPVKQITQIHDAHFQKRYPYLWCVANCLDGIGCVHTAAYRSLLLDVPKAAIFNPMHIGYDEPVLCYESRRKGLISPQVFKRWKHVDDLVCAIPYIDEDIDVIVAGDGIERHYMTSKSKCKPAYINGDGSRIWDVAVECGMEWLGAIPSQEVYRHMRELRTVVDPAWNLGFAVHGGHFNRVVVEAIVNGAIPLARNYGISDNARGIGEVFKSDTHYVMIPHDAAPVEFADIVNYANNLSTSKAEELQDNGFSIIHNWDRKVVAQQFVDLMDGIDTGWYGKLETAKTPQHVIDAAERYMRDFFGVDA